jgi:hypothetical protein
MKPVQLSEEHQRILRSQVFDDQPGPILHDFRVVLDYIGPEGVKAGGQYNLLPIAAIPELDEKLSRPLHLPLKRPQLRSHPYLQGLHLLLRASGLTRVDGVGDKARLVIDPEVLKSWQELNPTEQYFTLLEALFVRGRTEMVGESRGGWEGFLSLCLGPWQGSHRRRGEESGFDSWLIYRLQRRPYLLALMDLFGLLDVTQPKKPVSPWVPAGVKSTPFGDALAAAFGDFDSIMDLEDQLLEGEHRDEDEEDGEEIDEEAVSEVGGLKAVLGPWFPEWRNDLVLPEPERREGIFVFRVSLGEIWRQIAISSEDTLDSLASAILDAVRFDNDHLYEFTYRNRFGLTETITCPECDSERFTDEVLIGDLPLQPGESMIFHFDFGDDWRFAVTLERIVPPDAKKEQKLPRVLAKHGKAPRQYESWNEW